MTARNRSRSGRPRTRHPDARPRTVAWVLAGGGGRGAFQVGVVKALEEAGVAPDIILGSAVGAVNAGLYATGGPAHMEECWRAFDGRLWAPPLSVRHNPLFGRSLMSPRRLQRTVERHMDFEAIQGSATDIMFSVLNLSQGTLEILGNRTAESAEELRRIVRAAYAFPIVHPPVPLGKHYYLMGGLSGRVLIEHAVAAGATDVYVLQCFGATLPPTDALRSFSEVAGRLTAVACNRMARYGLPAEERAALRARGIAVTVFEPESAERLPGLFRSLIVHPDATEELMEAGYAHAIRTLGGTRRSSLKIVPLHARERLHS